MLSVAKLLLDETIDVLGKRGVRLEYEPEVAEWLLDQCGLDPQAGARPLRRLIKLWVEDAVADVLIENRAAEEVRLAVRIADGRPKAEVATPVAHRELT